MRAEKTRPEGYVVRMAFGFTGVAARGALALLTESGRMDEPEAAGRFTRVASARSEKLLQGQKLEFHVIIKDVPDAADVVVKIEVRLSRLRECDAIVRRLSVSSGFEEQIWQFPVVLLPCGIEGKPDSIVLRPIDSVDGMTAKAVPMPPALLLQMAEALSLVPGSCGVFYDLTNKPPATIEWE